MNRAQATPQRRAAPAGAAARARPHVVARPWILEATPGLLVALVAVASHLVFAPLVLPVAAAVGVAAGAVAHFAARRLAVTVFAGAVAPLLVPSLPLGIAALALLLLLLAALLARTGFPLLLAAGGIAWAHPAGSALAALGIALAVAWPGEGRLALLDRVVLAVAALAAVAGVFLAALFWAPLGGLAAGLGARGLARHPANAAIAGAFTGAAQWAAALPALFLFVLAALGRLPELSPLRTLAFAWGALGLGLLVLLLGTGLGLLFRARGPWAGIGAAATACVTMILVLGSFQAALLGGRIAGAGWPLLAPWLALGAVGLTKRLGPVRGWALAVLAACATPGLRFLTVT